VRDGAVHGTHVLDEVHVLLLSGSSKRLAALAHTPAEAMWASDAVAPWNAAANGRGNALPHARRMILSVATRYGHMKRGCK
jgi:hypothetical protein